MRKFFEGQLSFVLFGFIFWLPIGVLIVIVLFLANNIEDIGRDVLQIFLPQQYLRSGYGIIFGLVVVYVSGVVLKVTRIREVFSNVPVLGLFFGAGQVMTIDRLVHLAPCIFLLSPTCLGYGWILSEEKVRLKGEKAVFTLLNIYYPAVPSLVTGQIFPVRKDMVIRLGNTSKEVVDILLYSFRSPEDLKLLPWEGEAEEDFRKRGNAFGLDLATALDKTC